MWLFPELSVTVCSECFTSVSLGFVTTMQPSFHVIVQRTVCTPSAVSTSGLLKPGRHDATPREPPCQETIVNEKTGNDFENCAIRGAPKSVSTAVAPLLPSTFLLSESPLSSNLHPAGGRQISYSKVSVSVAGFLDGGVDLYAIVAAVDPVLYRQRTRGNGSS